MRADPADQLRLLELAELDRTAGRLGHRRRTLPEARELTGAEAEVDERRAGAAAVQASVDDLAAQQAVADSEVAEVRARIDRNRRLMDAGMAAKDLGHVQHETESLERRQRELEDAELEVMEELEEAQGALEAARRRLAESETTLGDAVDSRDAALADIDAQEAEAAVGRDGLVAVLPEALLSLYESIRAGSGDTGAALLTRGRCEGCHLDLSATAIDDIRSTPPDEVVRCDECLRILVRTEASGL